MMPPRKRNPTGDVKPATEVGQGLRITFEEMEVGMVQRGLELFAVDAESFVAAL
jgi:hypothetical protein